MTEPRRHEPKVLASIAKCTTILKAMCHFHKWIVTLLPIIILVPWKLEPRCDQHSFWTFPGPRSETHKTKKNWERIRASRRRQARTHIAYSLTFLPAYAGAGSLLHVPAVVAASPSKTPSALIAVPNFCWVWYGQCSKVTHAHLQILT